MRLVFLGLLALPAIALWGCPIDPSALPPMTFDIAEADFWRAPPGPPPPAPGEGRIYVTNNLDDTVTVLDLDTLDVIATVPVGFVPVEREGPHHVAVDPAGEHFYVGISNYVVGGGSGPHGVHGSGTAEGHITKYRTSDHLLVGAVRVDRNPGDVRLTPDGRTLLASHFDLLKISEAAAAGIESGPELDARVAIVDAGSLERRAFVDTCPAPHGIAITADSATAVVSCYSDEVAIIDLATLAVTRVAVLEVPGTARAPICSPYAVTMDNRTAWVSCYNTGLLIAVDVDARALDGRTHQLVGKAAFGEVRAGVLAIAHQATDGITLIDTATATELSTKIVFPDVCILPHAVRFSEDGTQLLVVCEGNRQDPGQLLLLDATAPHDVVKTAPLGRFPDDMAIMRRAP